MRRLLISMVLLLGLAYAAEEKPEKMRIQLVNHFYNPNKAETAYNQGIRDLMKKHPDWEVIQWASLALPGGNQQSQLMLALAAGNSPDIGHSCFHTIGSDIEQRFLYPMNEWIGDDLNHDGVISGDEVKWPEWNNVPKLWQQVATRDGKIYGLPVPQNNQIAIVYRVDLVEQAGLDPSHPPKTWDELYEWCKVITDPDKRLPGASKYSCGQKAIGVCSEAYKFLPWIYSAGGEPFVQDRVSPKTGKVYTFGLNEDKFITEEGEDLSRVPSNWRANWDTEEGRAALDFLNKLRWGKFMKNGKEVTGVAYPLATGYGDFLGQLGTGEIAMMVTGTDDLEKTARYCGIDPSLLSWFPFPASDNVKGRQVVQIFRHYAVMYANLGKRSKKERDAVWEVMQQVYSLDNEYREVENLVLSGFAGCVAPSKLTAHGFKEYVNDVPIAVREAFQGMENGTVLCVTEPFAGHWITINDAMQRRVLGILMGANGYDFDYKKAWTELQKAANSGLMYALPEEVVASRRPIAYCLFALIVSIIAVFLYKIIASYKLKNKVGSKSVYKGWLPVLLLVPALLLITCWRYYPLIRGMYMALQDYRVIGESKFVWLDNFINLAYDRSFWISIWRTLYYVALNMTLVFLAPIFLAILLTEVPKGKIFYRTLFFLPHMTSGIVIALLWKLMYSPSPGGFFNQILALLNVIPGVNIPVQTWLSDPNMAMICCVIPSVWAGMGMGSLIYLAALQSLPKELYEAADVDGATWLQKLRHITIPYLLPLIVINFVGSFIGTFQGMGNIFLLTFGGPGDATMVVGMKIWQEAYVNLHFSMATSMAWVLGAGLIGMTYVQIQFLKKVEYKRAST